MYRVKVFTDIEDNFLKTEWERLEQENNIFPQSSYHWCSTWWRYLRGKRKLHVVLVTDSQNKAVVIAPLCIDRDFGIPVLRSFPIHFGDFYTFISSPKAYLNGAMDTVFQYIQSNRLWRWVRLDKIYSLDKLAKYLTNYGYQKKRLSGCVIADFSGLTWEEYICKLRRKFRQNIRNRVKKIQNRFKSELRIIRTWSEYKERFFSMVKIYECRWADDYRPYKSSQELTCWKEVIKNQFEKGNMIYSELLFNGVPVAYRLGFIYKKTFYDWHTSYNPDYRKYHPGVMSLTFMIKDFLMKNDIHRINFMAGEYGWKLDWSPERKTELIFMFTSPSSNSSALVLNFYYHRMRDKLREQYHRILKYRTVRKVSRKVFDYLKRRDEVK